MISFFIYFSGEVEEIANLATYVCSDYANWINADVSIDFPWFYLQTNILTNFQHEQQSQPAKKEQQINLINS